MRAWLCTVALLAGGCEKLLDLEPLTPSDAHARSDGRRDGRPGLDGPPSDATRVDAAADASATACPASYVPTSGMTGRYHVVSTPTTWKSAEAACELEGAGYTMHTHLAVFSSDQEASAVQVLAQTNTQAWIGLSSLMQINFTWVTNENTMGYPMTTSPPWTQGYPVVGTSVECVHLDGQARFINTNCGTTLGYVCECDDHAADPANF